MVDLRPYQLEAVERIEGCADRRILAAAPTGSGKTIIASELIRRARERGERCLLVDHRREITEQTCRKLFDAGLEFGLIQAGFPSRPHEPVQVASIQTLHARAMRGSKIELPSADLLILDECHHCRARTWEELLEAYNDARVVGLTATPARGDGRGLGNIFEHLIEVASVRELIDQKYLVPSRVYAPSRPDLTGVRVQRGDYVESELADRVDTNKLVGDIVEHWHKLGENRPTVVFAVDVAHSKHLMDEFRKSGVKAEHIDGSTPLAERDDVLKRLAAGDIKMVTNCAVLTEGWDQPSVACVVLARPTKSLILFRQMVGRVLRPTLTKSDAIVLDHAGAVFMHGLVDDPIIWTLEENDIAENAAHNARANNLTTCPQCHSIRIKQQPCPQCGWVEAPVAVAEGKLETVTQEQTERAQRFYCMLLYIANERGRKPGWAWHSTKDAFGITISGRRFRPLEPTLQVREWVRKRDIAYARQMRGGRRWAH